MKSLIFILSCLSLTTFARKETFVGYRLITITPTLPEHLTFLQKIESNDYKLDFWDPAVELNRGLRVLVSPETYFKYRLILAAKNIKTEVLVENFQELIDEQLKSMEKSANNKNIIFRYARYNEIINFIDETVQDNPDLASSYVAGTTHEKRQLKVIVLKTQTSQRSVWIDCGIHAREWVSPSTCVYTINQLIAEYRANDPVAVALLNKYEVHILPSVNPDGYEYTHNTNRLWRKNRNPNAGSTCVGTDLNRNFDHQWRVSGASSIACSDTYAGPSRGSELETQAIVNAINAKIGQWDIFLTIHSYSDLWLVPFAYSLTERPADYNDLLEKALIGAAALEAVHGEKYEVGQASQILYLHSGVSNDWAKAVANIKYTYLLELRPGRNTPEAIYGFTYPEDRMPLVATETYAGLKAIINAL